MWLNCRNCKPLTVLAQLKTVRACYWMSYQCRTTTISHPGTSVNKYIQAYIQGYKLAAHVVCGLGNRVPDGRYE